MCTVRYNSKSRWLIRPNSPQMPQSHPHAVQAEHGSQRPGWCISPDAKPAEFVMPAPSLTDRLRAPLLRTHPP